MVTLQEAYADPTTIVLQATIFSAVGPVAIALIGQSLSRPVSLWRLCQQIHGELCYLPRCWYRCLALSSNRAHLEHTYLWAKRYPPTLPIWLEMFWGHKI